MDNIYKEPVKIPTIKVGDWVTQYSAGYWKVIDIFPKYADEDFKNNGHTYKKGDRIGDWVILKKGFSAKMKPYNACEITDSQWCNPVSEDIAQTIEKAFNDNPKAKEKFDKSPNLPTPSVMNIWLGLTDEQVDMLSETLNTLPNKFSLKEFKEIFASYRQHLADPSKATHILNLFSYLWEIDDNFEPLHFGTELKKIDH